MLRAIFYARFHPRRGPCVVHQFPPNAVVSCDQSKSIFPFTFSELSPYVIPPYELCNRALSVCLTGYRILGFPISLEDPKYDRNRFTFNVCFVLDENEAVTSWSTIVRKTGAFFRNIEEQDGILQSEELLKGLRWADADDYPASGVGSIHTLLRRIMEDLNTHGETCARVDKTNVLNLRLFPERPAPPRVQVWDVPLLIRALPDPEEWTWDLALTRIRSFIDGINHVQRIATLANVEVRLVKRAIRELVYHRRAMLLDIFHFGAIYAPTVCMSVLVRSVEAQDECRAYIYLEPSSQPLHQTGNAGRRPITKVLTNNPDDLPELPERDTIVSLYSSLSQGLTVHDFALAHQKDLVNIDIRRFITFGVIKGFLRRVHKYALISSSVPTKKAVGTESKVGSQSPTKLRVRVRDDHVMRELDRAWKKAALSSGWATPPASHTALTSASGSPTVSSSLGKSAKSTEEAQMIEDARLRPYLDGKCCFDQIAVEMGTSEKRIIDRLRSRRFEDVVIFCR